jgi:threonine dehydrogenase-like Zn-dependent dehydrogenase
MRVLVPAITKCGRCEYCQHGMPSHCQTVGGIGWIFGHLIDGTQAESVRVPYADTSLYELPAGVTNEQAIFLADSLPTGYEVGVLAGQVRPGDTVAVVGAGAVGLAAILTTGLWGASKVIAIDRHGHEGHSAAKSIRLRSRISPVRRYLSSGGARFRILPSVRSTWRSGKGQCAFGPFASLLA